jgi:co-chaperonin GroES (HSP10)
MIMPTSGRLVLQKIKEEDKPKGSLILPSTQPKQDRYLIIKSSDCIADDMEIVYIDKHKGVEITKDGQTYLVVNEEDVIAYEAD